MHKIDKEESGSKYQEKPLKDSPEFASGKQVLQSSGYNTYNMSYTLQMCMFITSVAACCSKGLARVL